MKTAVAAVPRLVEFENNPSHKDRLDEIQALNTVLCFLCSINADVAEVERFLSAHPEALLLEGVSRYKEESARFILAHGSTNLCHERSCCQQNKRQILDQCLSKDFFFYLRQGKGITAKTMTSRKNVYTSRWREYGQDIVLMEQDIRHWRREEWQLRQEMLQLTLETQAAALKKQDEEQQQQQRPPLLRLVNCATALKRVGEEREQEERHTTMESLRERHKVLVLEIRRSRQLQFRLLKQAFPGVRRHACGAH